MIESILGPVAGVEKILVNVPLKNVIVDHKLDLISAKDIENVLNQNHFGATIKRDGGSTNNSGSKGRSRFFVDQICCASEIPAIKSIIYPMEGIND